MYIFQLSCVLENSNSVPQVIEISVWRRFSRKFVSLMQDTDFLFVAIDFRVHGPSITDMAERSETSTRVQTDSVIAYSASTGQIDEVREDVDVKFQRLT